MTQDDAGANPQKALGRIRELMKTEELLAKSLLAGLLLSVEYDGGNIPPKPPTVNRVFAACKPAASTTVLSFGIVLTTREAHNWLGTIAAAPRLEWDNFRQKFRNGGLFEDVFKKEAYRRSERTICLTYAQCLHLFDIGDVLEEWSRSVKKEFGL